MHSSSHEAQRLEAKRHYSPSETRDLTDHYGAGVQQLYYFENGYGASVIKHTHSYGWPDLWELAVLRQTNPGGFDYILDWDLCYDTPVTNDFLGHLIEEEVQSYLDQIAAL